MSPYTGSVFKFLNLSIQKNALKNELTKNVVSNYSGSICFIYDGYVNLHIVFQLRDAKKKWCWNWCDRKGVKKQHWTQRHLSSYILINHLKYLKGRASERPLESRNQRSNEYEKRFIYLFHHENIRSQNTQRKQFFKFFSQQEQN